MTLSAKKVDEKQGYHKQSRLRETLMYSCLRENERKGSGEGRK